jgi:hypothetical protein
MAISKTHDRRQKQKNKQNKHEGKTPTVPESASCGLTEDKNKQTKNKHE